MHSSQLESSDRRAVMKTVLSNVRYETSDFFRPEICSIVHGKFVNEVPLRPSQAIVVDSMIKAEDRHGLQGWQSVDQYISQFLRELEV
jgi:hypothetical protein